MRNLYTLTWLSLSHRVTTKAMSLPKMRMATMATRHRISLRSIRASASHPLTRSAGKDFVMTQNSFYRAETFDLGINAVTYSATLGSAKYTAGVAYYGRLDTAAGGFVNGFMSALWAPGTGTAGTVYLGLYSAVPGSSGESNATLYQLGVTANVGGVAAGTIRKTLTDSLSNLGGFPATGMPNAGNPAGALYGALLVATDAGTDHVDVASSTAFAANTPANTDPTGNGGYPRAFKGAGTALTVLPATEALSGITAVTLLPYFGLD
jgi:hypothetical protein